MKTAITMTIGEVGSILLKHIKKERQFEPAEKLELTWPTNVLLTDEVTIIVETGPIKKVSIFQENDDDGA